MFIAFISFVGAFWPESTTFGSLSTRTPTYKEYKGFFITSENRSVTRKPPQPSCHRCLIPEGVLLKYNITANGKYQFFWYCTRCECITPRGTFLRHEDVEKFNLPPLFYVKALLYDYQVNVYCQICGGSGAEVHHMAPQSLRQYFGDNWCKWPTINLCCACHRLWHVTVTPWMPGYNSDPLALEIMQKYKVTT